ncbi:MAG: DUF664 domain-containing protein [Dehalococcoidia bacterium]|nr:MAG: DUF664 domain-containing protein [Dehalococcoidia bacterium]
MAPDYLRNMVAYTAWADGRVLDAAAHLTDGQLAAEAGGSRGSLLDNLRHVAGAQARWHQRIRGLPIEPQPDAPANRLADWLRDLFAGTHADLDALVAPLSDDDAGRDVAVGIDALRRKQWPLWQLVAHVTLHSTQHRAETAVALTALGASPGDLDYGHFVDERHSASPGTLDMMRALYGFNRWGNTRILAKLAGLEDGELLAPRGLSHGSIGIDLAHAMLAERGWLSIWQSGAPEVELPRPAGGGHLDNLVAAFASVDDAIDGFIALLPPDELGTMRVDNADAHNPSVEKARALPLWDMMFHVVNHTMQHRAETAQALTALGRSPGDLDLLEYLDTAE